MLLISGRIRCMTALHPTNRDGEPDCVTREQRRRRSGETAQTMRPPTRHRFLRLPRRELCNNRYCETSQFSLCTTDFPSTLSLHCAPSIERTGPATITFLRTGSKLLFTVKRETTARHWIPDTLVASLSASPFLSWGPASRLTDCIDDNNLILNDRADD